MMTHFIRLITLLSGLRQNNAHIPIELTFAMAKKAGQQSVIPDTLRD